MTNIARHDIGVDMDKTVSNYPCDDCGFEGPHAVHWDEGVSQLVAECGGCGIEFGVPAEALDRP